MSTHAVWDAYMRSYDFLNAVDSYRQSMQDIAASIRRIKGTTILDAGSGTGNLSMLLKERGARVTSCDFSQSALAAHRMKDPDAIQVNASLEEALPFNDQEFDTVCCASVLFALTKKGCRLALSEFRRILRPGGQLIVTVVSVGTKRRHLVKMFVNSQMNKYGRARGFIQCLHKLPNLLQVLHYNKRILTLPDWHGCHLFTESELRTFVEDAGFCNVHVRRCYGERFLLLIAQHSVPSQANMLS